MSHLRDLGCCSLALQGWTTSCIALELARNALHGTAYTRGRKSQKEQCNLGTSKAPGEDKGVHNCPRALIPKELTLGSTHRACKHFLASFVFSHSTSEPPLAHQVNLSLLMGQSTAHILHARQHREPLALPALCDTGGQGEGRTQAGETPLPTLPGQPTHSRVAAAGEGVRRRLAAGWDRAQICAADTRKATRQRCLARHCWEVCHAGGCWQHRLLGHVLCVALF